MEKKEQNKARNSSFLNKLLLIAGIGIGGVILSKTSLKYEYLYDTVGVTFKKGETISEVAYCESLRNMGCFRNEIDKYTDAFLRMNNLDHPKELKAGTRYIAPDVNRDGYVGCDCLK